MKRTATFLAMMLLPGAAWAAPHLPATEMGLVWILPFVGMLLSIAILPLATPQLWHHHFGKISGFWAATFLLPAILAYGIGVAAFEALHVLLSDYIPFIILIAALFTVTGGIRLKGSLVGTPGVNVGLLAAGALAASAMGTTGAAMLLIRPLIRANAMRRHRTHIFVFFIFAVANIGGALTPLGDPPLFLGFLKGVQFFWFAENLFLPTVFALVWLLGLFYLLDRRAWAKEHKTVRALAAQQHEEREPITLEGAPNLVLLAGVVGVVLFSGVWKPSFTPHLFGVELPLPDLARNLLLLGICWLSMKITHADARAGNDFSWGPIIEVGKLFAGIFITIAPCVAILKASEAGALAELIRFVNPGGVSDPARYFWLAGLLSSFLDNAPTFLVFFNAAGGDPVALMGTLAPTLAATSAGAVFMGANSYIGNAPNFMVKAVVEERGITMPSFFAYIGWAVAVLIPLFIVQTYVFFR